MRYCVSEGCSGLDPCEGCAQARRRILMCAVTGAGLSKETAEKFFRAYADAFETATIEITKALEAAQNKRLEEKAAREKNSDSNQDKGKERDKNKKTTLGPAVHKTTVVVSLKDKLAKNSSYGKEASHVTVETPKNGQPPKKDPAAHAADDTHEHAHKD